MKRGWKTARDVALIMLVMWGVHAWQTRNLPVDQIVPDSGLVQGDGKGVVYFFAP